MIRLFFLGLIATLASSLPLHAQEKKDPPKEFTNSIGMKFVWIKPGTFLMGSPKEEDGRKDNETQHKVTLTKGFYMGVYAVTQEQWKEVMGDNPSHFKGDKNLPVESVSWEDCQGFIKKLREKDRRTYRLPTEAEWEFACRAGTKMAFCFGDDENMLGQYGWYSGNSEDKTHPVGQKKPNKWGIFDMQGNVGQWCQDWLGDYPQKDVVDPKGPDAGKHRVLRGGCWFNYPRHCRSAFRNGFVPDVRIHNMGLRVCFSLEEDGVPAPKKDPPKKEEVGVPPKNFTNSIGMKFVWIPAGNFMMGSPKAEKDRWDHETQHKVKLSKGFYMGVHTVTQEQWQAVMGNNPSHFKGEKNLPVEKVSWDDCQEFVKKLRNKDKKQYRLPTESEWEYACRAGTTTPFHFGETISTDQANYNGDLTYGDGKKGVYRKKTTPVGNFPANAWGLHDMHGNVLQWCQDWYGDYPQNDAVDPQGAEKGAERVLRGGSWSLEPLNCRSAFRIRFVPGYRDPNIGLRVCFFAE